MVRIAILGLFLLSSFFPGKKKCVRRIHRKNKCNWVTPKRKYLSSPYFFQCAGYTKRSTPATLFSIHRLHFQLNFLHFQLFLLSSFFPGKKKCVRRIHRKNKCNWVTPKRKYLSSPYFFQCAGYTKRSTPATLFSIHRLHFQLNTTWMLMCNVDVEGRLSTGSNHCQPGYFTMSRHPPRCGLLCIAFSRVLSAMPPPPPLAGQARQGERGHKVMRGRWVPPPTEGKGSRKGDCKW